MSGSLCAGGAYPISPSFRGRGGASGFGDSIEDLVSSWLSNSDKRVPREAGTAAEDVDAIGDDISR